MASSADGRRHGRAAGGTPRELQFIGTTWLHRGAPYWLRRIKMTLIWLLITALTAAMTVGVGVAATSDGTVLVVLVSLYAVLCGGTAYVVTRHIRTIDRFGVMGGGKSPFGKRWDKAATVATVLVGVSVIFSFPVGLGAALPYLVRSFGRYAPGERYERKRVGLGV